MSKSKFIHTLFEAKSIFAIEQKAIVSCFVKNVAFLLGHPVFIAWLLAFCWKRFRGGEDNRPLFL